MRALAYLRYIALLSLVFISIGCRGCDDLGDPTNENCGDGTRDLLEVCDGDDLAGESCQTQGFQSGELACAPTCAGFVIAGCSGEAASEDPCARCDPTFELCVEGACINRCEQEPFDGDGRFDVDLRTVRVTGTVTVDGAPFTNMNEIGRLSFLGSVSQEPVLVDVSESGTFEVRLYAGSYRVGWVSDGSADPAGVQFDSWFAIVDDWETSFDIPGWQTVQGTVTLGGEQPSQSDFDGDRGELVFEHLGDEESADSDVADEQSGEHPTFPRTVRALGVPVSDDGSFTARLRDGDYRIWWARSEPQSKKSFLTEWTFDAADSAGSALEFDIPLRHVEFRFTLDGEVFSTPDRPAVDAVLLLGHDIEHHAGFWPQYQQPSYEFVELDQFGRGSAWILAGEYSVELNGSSSVDGPIHGFLKVEQRHRLDESGEVAFDIRRGRVEGVVERNGERVPNSFYPGASRGTVTFYRDDGSWIVTELGERGRAEFATKLPPGQWDVVVAGNYWSYALPVVPYTARRDVVVNAGETTELELDVPAVRLTGEVTANGEPLADERELDTRGLIEISNNGAVWHTIPLPARGRAAYDVILAPGDYEWSIARLWYASGDEETPTGVLPLGEWPAGTVSLEDATRRDVDLRLYEVEVELLVDGAQPAGLGSSRGTIWFEDRAQGRVTRQVEVPSDGPASIRTTLYPGRYVMQFKGADGVVDLPAEAVVLRERFDVTDDRRVEVDLGRVTIDGMVTLDGAPLPAPPAEPAAGRGSLEFIRLPKVAQGSKSVQVERSGPGEYSVDLLAGYHDVIFHSDPDNPDLLPQSAVVQRACGDAPGIAVSSP